MSQLVLLETLQEDALGITEDILSSFVRSTPLTNKQCMEVRQLVFPQLAQYLNEAPFSYQESLNVLKTLLKTQERGKFMHSGDSYILSQADIDDGLTSYGKTKEFEGIANTLYWGTQWSGTLGKYIEVEVDKQALIKELYRCTIHMIDGSTKTLRHNMLGPRLEPSEQEHNKKIVFYHARKIATTLRQQPTSFVANAPYGESEKAQGTVEADNVSDDAIKAKEMNKKAKNDKTVEAEGDGAIVRLVEGMLSGLLENARVYRQTVMDAMPSGTLEIKQPLQQELFVEIKSDEQKPLRANIKPS